MSDYNGETNIKLLDSDSINLILKNGGIFHTWINLVIGINNDKPMKIIN